MNGRKGRLNVKSCNMAPTHKKILKEINKSSKIFLCLHTSPDLDSLCSNYAMYRFLKHLKKKCDVYSCDELPNNYGLFETGFIKLGIDPNSVDFKPYDLIIGLDTSSEHMLSKLRIFKFPEHIRKINIDHHAGSNWAGINLVYPQRASTSLILYSFFKDIGFDMDIKIKKALLLGYLSDSGIFQYMYNSKDLIAAADLIDEGIDIGEMIWFMTFNTPYESFKYKVKVLSNVVLDTNRNIAWSKLSLDDKKELGGELPKDKKGAPWVDFFKDIKGIKFAVMFNEHANGTASASFRSNDRHFDVSVLARELGGGGHKTASAVLFRNSDLKKVVELVFEKIDSLYSK